MKRTATFIVITFTFVGSTLSVFANDAHDDTFRNGVLAGQQAASDSSTKGWLWGSYAATI